MPVVKNDKVNLEPVSMENVKNVIQSNLGLDGITGTGNTIRDRNEHTIDPDGNIENALKENYSDIEDDGPFADNSFEEDEDLDGADFAEAEALEDAIPEPADPAEFADREESGKGEEIASQAVKKADR